MSPLKNPRGIPRRRAPHEIPKKRVDDDEFAALLGGGSILNEFEPVIYLHGHIDGIIAKKFIEAVSEIEHDRESPIAIIDINTPGGDVGAMSAILSTMKGARVKFATYVSSEASSAGAVILSAGERGMRFASPFSNIMVHEMLIGTPLEPIEDTQRRVEFMGRQNDAMIDFLAKNCGKTAKQLRKILKDSGGRDYYMTPQQALDFGIIDHIKIPKAGIKMEVCLEAVE